MAAPYKTGIDYYPCDVGLVNDRKFRKLKNKYSAWVVVAYLAILDLIYKDKGYYIVYNEKTQDDIIYEVSQVLAGKYAPSRTQIVEAIDDMAACGLFSGDCFKSKILTSKRIQETYYRCTLKRKIVNVDRNIWLLSISEMKSMSEKSPILHFFINDGNNRVNDGNNGINDGINKQSKVNESKVNRKRERCSSAVLSLPEKNGNSFDISEEMYQGLVKTYANVNVMQSLEAMKAYYDANPQRRLNDYTAKINKWLTQDSVCGPSSVPAHPSSAVSFNLSEYENSSMFDD